MAATMCPRLSDTIRIQREKEGDRDGETFPPFIHSFTHSPFTVYTRPVINCLLTSEQVMACYCQLVCSPEYNDSCESVELQDKETLRLGREGAANCQQVEVTLDLHSKELHVRQLSSVYPSLAGVTLLKREGDAALIGPGAKLELMNQDMTVHVKYNVFFGQKKKSEASGGGGRDYVCHWYLFDSLLIMEYGPQVPSSLIAAFDLDSTLIKTRSGRLPFKAAGPGDWTFWMPCVPHKLRSTALSGYRIVIFTNQGGMNHGNPPIEEFKMKMEAVMADLGETSVTLLASLEEDEYRKPRTRMWNHFVKKMNEGLAVDMSESYYVGDAAGRPRHVKKDGERDFSCSDRKFAANLGLSFSLPEEYFLGEPPPSEFSWYGFNPHAYANSDEGPVLEPAGSFLTSEKQEVVVFVGPPAAGKTRLYTDYMKRERRRRYCHVSRDVLGSWQKCVGQGKEAMESGHSVVIDNTNPDPESRGRYVQLGREYGVPVRCFWFMTSIEHALHNNQFRNYCIENGLLDKDSKKGMVPDSAIRAYKSKFVEPALAEGFAEIVKVRISLTFKNKKLEELYMKFLD